MSRSAPGDVVHYRTPLGCHVGIVTGRAGDQAVMQLEDQPAGVTLPSQRPDGVVYAALGLPSSPFTYHSERGCDDPCRYDWKLRSTSSDAASAAWPGCRGGAA